MMNFVVQNDGWGVSLHAERRENIKEKKIRVTSKFCTATVFLSYWRKKINKTKNKKKKHKTVSLRHCGASFAWMQLFCGPHLSFFLLCVIGVPKHPPFLSLHLHTNFFLSPQTQNLVHSCSHLVTFFCFFNNK